MASYKQEAITAITEYIELIERIKSDNEKLKNKADLIFRGQPRDKPLLPKLARIRLNGSSIIKLEKIMLADFRRGIVPLTEFKPENNWDLLALAQHHGLPTRLLDWTYNALVALWFVVRNPAEKDEKSNSQDGVVWVLAAEVEDFRTDTEKTNPLSNKITKIFRSSVVTRRISAQAGVFTVHKINEENKVIRFETNRRFGAKLTKVIVPHSEFARLRKQLHILGVNYATVFPDIDGYCKHLEWRYSKYSDEIKASEACV